MGLAIWEQAYLGPDAEREGGSAGKTMGLFFLIWLVTFFVLFFVIKKITPNGYLLGVITAVLVYAAGRLFVHTRPSAETTITYCPSASAEGSGS